MFPHIDPCFSSTLCSCAIVMDSEEYLSDPTRVMCTDWVLLVQSHNILLCSCLVRRSSFDDEISLRVLREAGRYVHNAIYGRVCAWVFAGLVQLEYPIGFLLGMCCNFVGRKAWWNESVARLDKNCRRRRFCFIFSRSWITWNLSQFSSYERSRVPINYIWYFISMSKIKPTEVKAPECHRYHNSSLAKWRWFVTTAFKQVQTLELLLFLAFWFIFFSISTKPLQTILSFSWVLPFVGRIRSLGKSFSIAQDNVLITK